MFDLLATAVISLFIGIGIGWACAEKTKAMTLPLEKDPDDWWKRGDSPPGYGD